jgi:chromosome partitioning protein
MKVVSIAIHKGGAGKTTTAVNLAAWLAVHRPAGLPQHKVLLIDVDPQANATECFIDPEEVKNSIGDVLLRRCNISDAIITAPSLPSLHILPSKIEMLLQEYYGDYSGLSMDALKRALEQVKDKYDYVICDCPPNLMHFTKNALMASDHVIMPMEPEPLPFRGLKEFIGQIVKDFQRYNPVKATGVVLVHRAPNSRKYLPERIKKDIRALNPQLLFEQEIHLDQELAMMAEDHKPACLRAPGSKGGRDYLGLSIEFEARIPP